MNKINEKWSMDYHSNCGPREENQDNYLVIGPKGHFSRLEDEVETKGVIDDWSQNCMRIVVVDGMGGHAHGREFAEEVISKLVQLPFQTDAEALKVALNELHDDLFSKHFKGSKSPGCTLVMADIQGQGQTLIANIGDSRAYLKRLDASDDFTLLTHDHTEAELAWRAGHISDEDLVLLQAENKLPLAQAIGFGHTELQPNTDAALGSAKRHLPTLALNIDSEHSDIFYREIEKGQSLILASDGWWDKNSRDNATMVSLSRI